MSLRHSPKQSDLERSDSFHNVEMWPFTLIDSALSARETCEFAAAQKSAIDQFEALVFNNDNGGCYE